MEAYRDYIAEFREDLNRSIAIEKILVKHDVKCRDFIGLIQELHELASKQPEA